MILLAILACWMFVLVVVSAVCIVAGRADLQESASRRSESAARLPRLADWESAEHLAVYAHAARARGERRDSAPRAPERERAVA